MTLWKELSIKSICEWFPSKAKERQRLEYKDEAREGPGVPLTPLQKYVKCESWQMLATESRDEKRADFPSVFESTKFASTFLCERLILHKAARKRFRRY